MVSSRRPQALRASLTILKLEYIILQQMDENRLDLVGGKKPSRTRMGPVAKVQIINPSGDELISSLVTRLLAEFETAKPVEFLGFVPELCIIRHLIEGKGNMRSGRQERAVV